MDALRTFVVLKYGKLWNIRSSCVPYGISRDNSGFFVIKDTKERASKATSARIRNFP